MLSVENTALLIIDMQNDFCSINGGLDRRGYDVTNSRAIIPKIASLLQGCRQKGIRVFFVRGENSPQKSSVTWDNRPSATHDKDLGFRLIAPGTWGAQIVDELKPLPSEPVIVKLRYSAFIGTELQLLLKSCDIKTVIFAGTTTNVCVETSARDAFNLDYNVIVAADCVSSPEPDLAQASLKTIAKYFGRVDFSENILADIVPSASKQYTTPTSIG